MSKQFVVKKRTKSSESILYHLMKSAQLLCEEDEELGDIDVFETGNATYQISCAIDWIIEALGKR